MYFIGVAVDASSREVRVVGVDAGSKDTPTVRTLTYGEMDLPTALRDLHAAIVSTLRELPAYGLAVRRVDPSPQASLRTATIDRLLAEGAILAAARDSITEVSHLSGTEIGNRMGMSKAEALKQAKKDLANHGLPMKWADAAMAARSLFDVN